jgi:hypothetical protein
VRQLSQYTDQATGQLKHLGSVNGRATDFCFAKKLDWLLDAASSVPVQCKLEVQAKAAKAQS